MIINLHQTSQVMFYIKLHHSGGRGKPEKMKTWKICFTLVSLVLQGSHSCYNNEVLLATAADELCSLLVWNFWWRSHRDKPCTQVCSMCLSKMYPALLWASQIPQQHLTDRCANSRTYRGWFCCLIPLCFKHIISVWLMTCMTVSSSLGWNIIY